MSGDLSVEATGETVGEAKSAALRELERTAPGIDRDDVRFQVVTEGARGVLGVGYEPARVIASAPRPNATAALLDDAPPSDETAIAEELLTRVLAALGLPGTVQTITGADGVEASISGSDPAVLIGRHGQTIDALETLANTLAFRAQGDTRKRITIDIDGYRDRRQATLEATARTTAERVAATGNAVTLEPMSAAERRIVHEALKDDPAVETVSDGAEPNRCVRVIPRHTAI